MDDCLSRNSPGFDPKVLYRVVKKRDGATKVFRVLVNGFPLPLTIEFSSKTLHGTDFAFHF
jgi:hypothetical protein